MDGSIQPMEDAMSNGRVTIIIRASGPEPWAPGGDWLCWAHEYHYSYSATSLEMAKGAFRRKLIERATGCNNITFVH